jgi:lycopene cyclase domain-containing protein
VSYSLLSLIFLVIAALVLGAALTRADSRRALINRWWLPVTVGGIVALVLTAVFDNVMIGVGLVAYDRASISGLSIGLAPLEDFAYPLAGLMLLPSLWLLLGKRGANVHH